MLLVVSRDLFRAFPSSLCQPLSPFGPGAIMHSLVPLGMMKQSASLTVKIRPTERACLRSAAADRAEERSRHPNPRFPPHPLFGWKVETPPEESNANGFPSLPPTRMCLLYTFQPERQPTSQRNESFEMSFKAAIHVNHVCRNSYCILFMA